jgi:hypothetical protein
MWLVARKISLKPCFFSKWSQTRAKASGENDGFHKNQRAPPATLQGTFMQLFV